MTCQWENRAARIERLDAEEKHNAKIGVIAGVLLFIITPFCFIGMVLLQASVVYWHQHLFASLRKAKSAIIEDNDQITREEILKLATGHSITTVGYDLDDTIAP